MTRALIQIAALAIFLFMVWRAFRLAMALRYSRAAREGQRRAEEAQGRRVVAEVPSHTGEVYLFLESADAFSWPARRVPKAEIDGARLLLNGGLMATAARPGVSLPEPAAPEEFEGRERWEVRLYTAQGPADVPCGTVREGVSREAARAVFDAVKRAIGARDR